MTEITKDHVEWTVVDRFGKMLAAPPSEAFGVTETYALFTATLCWVVQHMRIPEGAVEAEKDWAARDLLELLNRTPVSEKPWAIGQTTRLVKTGHTVAVVASPEGFEQHTVGRLLKNLRDALAHGDRRNVEPFNNKGRLVGFTFTCQEVQVRGRERTVTWQGKITLAQRDMQRIGGELVRLYCEAVRKRAGRMGDSRFATDAASISEKVA